MSLVELSEVKTYLRVPVSSTNDDSKVQAMIDAVTAVIEHHVGRVFATRTVTEHHYCSRGVLWLRTLPVISLTSVSSRDGLHSWTVGDLFVDNGTGRVTDAIQSLTGDLTVVYSAGGAVPDNVKEAAKVSVAYFWQSQNPGRPVDARFGDSEVAPVIQGFADLPNRAKTLLGPAATAIA